ncbi:MAG TPA: methylated-DNA--[protein]-cysteine S-methyltransferase, partial [Candidatus Binatia bacterium]|nr:methylated-DNA--[protein]-cysteine S-methyltransferase [Candidatus Binatia bacterium]
PTATRAVGAANGINPLALFVPYHRVIGADGTLTGYGGGIARKRWLLAHEGAFGEKALRTARYGVTGKHRGALVRNP